MQEKKSLEERDVYAWATSCMGGGSFREVERRVLLESPQAEPPDFWVRFNRSGWGAVLLMLLFISPIAGMAAPLSSPDITGWRQGFHPETSLVVAGICFTFSCMLMIWAMISWLRRERNRADAIAPAIYVLIWTIITLLMVINVDRLDETSMWAMPIYATTALSTLLLIAGIVAGRSKSQLSDDFDKPDHPVDLNQLSQTEAQKLLTIRTEILDLLGEMERLDQDKIMQAHHLPLGKLYTLDDE